VEHGDSIVFLHSVREGPANQSYGLQVAALAGVPRPIIERARVRLRELEQSAQRHRDLEANQLSLFAEPSPPAEPPADDTLKKALSEIDPDELTSRQALEALYSLKGLER